jgi:NTP-dependent ternary system trypsin peptidase co-occuring protein
MANFLKYELDDGTIVEVETGEITMRGRTGDVMRGTSSNPALDAPRRFSEAFAPAKAAALAVMQQLNDLDTDEVEVEFGLTTSPEVGNFAIGTVGVGANYKVKLKWKKT